MSERRPSRLEAAIASYRQRLLNLDAAALQAIEQAYLPGQESIVQLIDLLVSDIEAAGTISASDAARLARATELLRLIEAEVTRLAQAAGQVIPAAQQQAISQALQRAEALTVAQAPDAQAAAELARQWTGLNRGALENLVGALSDGSPLNDWLRDVAGQTVDEARRVLMDGITRGINPRAIGRDLARVSGMPLHRAQTASRTLMMDSYRAASIRVMQENDSVLAGWQWSSAHGPRTCLSCLARDDGTVYPLSVTFFPGHLNCRCSPIPKLKDDDDMPPIETGQEWFDKQPQDVKDRMVPVGLRDDFRSGRVTLYDMATLQRNPEFGDRWRQSTITEARANAARRRGGGAASPAQTPRTVSGSMQSVETFERDIWNRTTERAAVFDPATGRELFRQDGTANEVTFTDEQIARMRGAIATHNHPSGRSFSLQDIVLADRAGLREIRAVGGEYVYIMRPASNGRWVRNGTVQQALARQDRLTRSILTQRMRSGELTVEQANALHNHFLMENYARVNGLTYQRIPAPWKDD